MSSADQELDLDRRVCGVTVWATGQRLAVDRVVTEVGCAFSGGRKRFLALLRDAAVSTVVVEHRDRFARRYGSRAATDRGRRAVQAAIEDDPV